MFMFLFMFSYFRGALKYIARSYSYAVNDLSEAIRLDQTCALAYYNRALSYRQLGEHKSSLKDFGIVLLLGDYLNFKVYVNRALLYYKLEDYSNSLSDFAEARKFEPNNQNIIHMIGLCYHK
jgi:tetratricopeptide (TPR) repeat protein